MSSAQKAWVNLRPYQQEAFWCELRMFFLLWARQKGKSFTLACRAMRRMMDQPNHLVIFASASVLLGGELLLKEAEVWRTVINQFRSACGERDYKLVTSADASDGALLDIDAIADLFEHNKLEAKVYHSRTNFSRTRVVAPNPATAVGWTGDVYMDEVGRIENLKDVFEAVIPIIESNPKFELLMATTPPPDDKHYSFEMFQAPSREWKHSARGNWYLSPSNIDVHRVDAWDGQLANVNYYHPKTRAPITPDEHRALAFDKVAWDRNHAVQFIQGGTAAVSLADLARAMEIGKTDCAAFSTSERVFL